MILFSTRESISLRVPRWNFIAVTRPHDAQRIYVRVKSDEKNTVKINTTSVSNLLSVPYSQLKAEAEEIVNNSVACILYNLYDYFEFIFLKC